MSGETPNVRLFAISFQDEAGSTRYIEQLDRHLNTVTPKLANALKGTLDVMSAALILFVKSGEIDFCNYLRLVQVAERPVADTPQWKAIPNEDIRIRNFAGVGREKLPEKGEDDITTIPAPAVLEVRLPYEKEWVEVWE